MAVPLAQRAAQLAPKERAMLEAVGWPMETRWKERAPFESTLPKANIDPDNDPLEDCFPLPASGYHRFH